ncbi:MAG: SDR family oxidoreductase [Pirellulales bacterium]|nr:SDR family oxidoreductase [Pirellulales bacterium]
MPRANPSNPERAAAPVALVTGSGKRRVGNCVVRDLAARGYRVVVHANTSLPDAQATAADIVAGGGIAIALAAELSDERQVERLVTQTLGAFGRIDVLVNTAAVWVPRRLEDTTAEDVRRQFEVNTLGTFLCCQRAGLAMVAQPTGGVIVNVGDWAVVRPYLDYAAYFASKGAIETLTRTFAVELGTRNPRVRVNAVLPGPVMLPDDMPEAERAAVIAATVVKREGRPEHVASAVFQLIENDFLTGVALPVDGGRSIFAP